MNSIKIPEDVYTQEVVNVIEDIQNGIKRLVEDLNSLNSNLEYTCELGQETEKLANIWSGIGKQTIKEENDSF